MKPVLVVLFGSFLVAGAVGCTGGDDDGGDGASGSWGCDKIADSDACIEYTGSQWSGSERDTYEAECTDDGGTVVDACPTEDLGGTCLLFEGTAAASEQHYYAEADLEMAEQVCTATGGTWETP